MLGIWSQIAKNAVCTLTHFGLLVKADVTCYQWKFSDRSMPLIYPKRWIACFSTGPIQIFRITDSSGLSLARVEEIDSRVSSNGPVGVLATSVDAGEGLLMEKHLFPAHVWIPSALLWQLWPHFALVEKGRDWTNNKYCRYVRHTTKADV